ncbi:MAG TPA: tetratricopeptide repeat protein, partial [Candidatus Saccharimonadales bacterium]|nr:tetratricopeptide repeat protein [Candidatus Saccharimonadales bacterium]
ASSLKSVVVITHFGREGKEDGVGAGFIVDPDGLVATSLHVIGEARPVRVRLPDGAEREVLSVQAWDTKFDLAILRIEAHGLPALALGDSDAVKQGAPVIALGNPLGLEHSVVQGVLSARREIEGISMLQIAIPIEPGNSGGPLLDLKGRVQGVLTLKSAMTPNLGFAMPVNLLKALLDHPNPVPMSRWLTLGALNPKDWSQVGGAHWSQKAGRIQVEGAGKGFGGRSLCLSQLSVPQRPYEVGASVRLDDESGAAGLVFASDGKDTHYGFYPSAGQLRLTRFEGPNVYSWTILKQVPSEHYRRGEWNHLRVRVEENKILCYVNGHLVVESGDDALSSGRVGLSKFRDTRAEFKEFQVGTNVVKKASGAEVELPATLLEQIRDAGPDEESRLLADLEKQGAAGRDALNQEARQREREAHRFRRIAAELHRRNVQAELVKTLDDTEPRIDLLRASLLVAQLDNPEVDLDHYRRQMAEMASEIRTRFAEDATEPAKLRELREYLFAENGFHGSRSDYYNKANSYVNQVLDDREGLPITLSVVFLDLAERLGIPRVSGLPLPGHFMVRYRAADPAGPDQIIDVFDGGKVLSRSDAQERVLEATGEGFRDADERSATKREIIVRMLRNLLGIAVSGEPGSDPLRYLDIIIALMPDSVRDRMERAQLRLQTGDTAGAKADFKWVLDQQPPGVDLERLAELYRSL